MTARVLQANFHHDVAASAVVECCLVEGQTSLASIQEPWVANTRVLGLEATEVCNDDLVAAFVDLKGWSGARVIVCSAYLPGERDSPPEDLARVVDYATRNKAELLVGCDANAHHTWGSTDINSRGPILYLVRMKTAAAVLQELAVKLGRTPEYECLLQSGPQHQSTFEYRCTLLDESTTASARSKKEAKQEAASALLTKLSRAGHAVPPPWGLGGLGPGGQIGGLASGGLGAGAPMCSPGAVSDPHSYVALLKEYCEEYKLPAPEYTLIGDSGPPHHRSFTIRAAVGAHSRDATALNKKTARQMAAESIYKYLRGCLRSTQDFVEADALARSIDKKMGRFKEERKEVPLRPSLSQKISEYHYGLVLQFDERKRAAALEALQSTSDAGQPPEIQLTCAASALGLEPEWNEMPTNSGKVLIAVELPTTSPSLVHLGYDRDDAAINMIGYLRMCLPNPKRPLVSDSMDL